MLSDCAVGIAHNDALASYFFGPISASRLLASVDAQRVSRTANDLVTNTRQVADPSAADQHDRVFLQIVAFARNVNRDFLAIAQSNTR